MCWRNDARARSGGTGISAAPSLCVNISTIGGGVLIGWPLAGRWHGEKYNRCSIGLRGSSAQHEAYASALTSLKRGAATPGVARRVARAAYRRILFSSTCSRQTRMCAPSWSLISFMARRLPRGGRAAFVIWRVMPYGVDASGASLGGKSAYALKTAAAT